MGGHALMANSMSRRGAQDGWPSTDGEQHVEKGRVATALASERRWVGAEAGAREPLR